MDNKISVELFKRLNENNVNYAVLRNYKTLPESLGGSDLDLWVSHEKVKDFFRIVEEVAKEQDAHLVSFLPDSLCPKVCYLSKDCGIQIDVFCGCIPYQNTEMIEGTVILEHTKVYNGIRVLDDRLADLVAFIKEIINNGKAEDKYTMPLYANSEQYTSEYIQSILTLFAPRFSEMLAVAICHKQLESKFGELKRLGNYSLKPKNLFWHKLSKLSRLRYKPGYVISVQGADCRIRDAFLENITPWMEEAFHKGITQKLFNSKVLSNLGVVGSVVRYGYDTIHYTLNYILTIFPKVATKSKVFILESQIGGVSFMPKPDLILKFGGSPNKACRGKAIWIDTTKEYEESIQLAKEAIIKSLSQRFENTVLS